MPVSAVDIVAFGRILLSTTMATTAPPWKAWSLDDRFLADLDEWTKKHPEDNKLDIVLDKICEAIKDAKPWIDLIPNSPFPAGSLIQGLAAVVQLGHVCWVFIP